MPDFKAARTNMVDCQIKTAGVITPAILTAFETLPREKFVPANMQSVAYIDEDVPVGEGRFLLEPMVHARMIEAIQPKPSDRALDIGGATGYSASVFSSLVTDVVALEENTALLQKAEDHWANLGANNVRPAAGKMTEGAPALAPFDIIFINGAVSEIPQAIANQLSSEGRLIAIIRPAGAVIGQVTIFRRSGKSGLSAYPLFESGCPYLPGFEPRESFAF